MTWTSEKPSKPGYYFHRGLYSFECVYYIKQAGTMLYAVGVDRDYDIELLEGRWAGPITPPEEP